jgi:hypothetical protein
MNQPKLVQCFIPKFLFQIPMNLSQNYTLKVIARIMLSIDLSLEFDIIDLNFSEERVHSIRKNERASNIFMCNEEFQCL